MASSQRFRFIEGILGRSRRRGLVSGPCDHDIPLSQKQIGRIAQKKREIDPGGQIAHQLAMKIGGEEKQ